MSRIQVYCKKQPAGEFVRIPLDWKVQNYRCEKGFTEELIPLYEYCKSPYFIGSMTLSETLEEMCNKFFKHTPLIQANFWLAYYYDYNIFCVLAAEENYFAGSNHDAIEVIL